MQNAQNSHAPFPSHIEQTVIYYRDPNYTLHGLGYLLPSLSSNMAQQKMTIEAASVTFFKQKATPALPNSDSLTTLLAIFQCACPSRPRHTHIKQTWRFELVKVKALKYKSSCTTGVNPLLSSFTSTNLANLLCTHIHQRQFWLKNVFGITSVCNTSITERTSVLQLHTILPLQNVLQYYNCIQYFHLQNVLQYYNCIQYFYCRTYFSITAACNTSIIEWRHLETKTNTSGSNGKEWENYIMRSIKF